MTTLLIPEKTDPEFEQVFRTWTESGGQIKRLGKYWIKDEELANQEIAIYGNQTFSLVLAQIYDVDLISPDDTLIARLDHAWTKRNVLLKPISEITPDLFPIFIKPVIPKLFLAGIFRNISEFKSTIKDLPDFELTLVSNVINDISAEARSYVMDGTIKDLALYEGSGNLKDAQSFLTDFISANLMQLPKVVVIDLGYSQESGWFILEFNACWGAGLNNCNAEKVIDCIIAATKPLYKENEMKKLFLDDVRTIEMVYDKSMVSEFDIVRTYEEFVSYITVKGLPNFISFDNDLGLGEDGNVAPDGYAAAKWLVYESGLDLRNLEFKVHSANPVAAEQIKGLLTNYIKHLNEEKR